MNKSNIPHVVIRLMGGLGNQLFMYAFAKSLSMKNMVPLKLDIMTGFLNDKTYKRNYGLQHFLIDEELTSDWESFNHLWGKRRRKLTVKINSFLPLVKRSYIKERVRAFDKGIYDMPITRPVYFEGYWQSYKYFEWIGDLLRNKLISSPVLIEQDTQEVNLIRSSNSVCLGIRRFTEVPEEKRTKHTILDIGYFRKAVQIIEQTIPEPHFFVFTQDREWARMNITSGKHKLTFIEEKDPSVGAVIDLWLMSLCKHHVISNSTLHWWAAWLNPASDKIVIAPRVGWANKDILPPSWNSIDIY